MKLEKLFSRYQSIIPDYNVFLDRIRRPLLRSFRINTLKGTHDEIYKLLQDIRSEPLPFYREAFQLDKRTKIGNHITHNLGYIYVQEVASMLPVLVLDPQPNEVVLDLCAAPGSKTTQIAQCMHNTGLLVVNELSRKRIHGLVHNLKRCGVLNEAVINIKGQNLDRIVTDYFDRVLIDAPCSAEGTIRKSKAVLYHWGERNIKKMARIQKGLIVSGFRTLCPGGTLVYSTCTIAPEENEAVITYLLEKFPEAEIMPISIPHFTMRPALTAWQGVSFDRRVKRCVRIWPQDNDTAPFFIAKITKRGVVKHRVDYKRKIESRGSIIPLFKKQYGVPDDRFTQYSIVQQKEISFITTPQVYALRELRTFRKGLEIGKIYEKNLKPDNDFTQLFGRNVRRNALELQTYQLKKYLRGDVLKIGLKPDIKQEFVILTYKQLPIGIGRYNGRELRSTVKRDRRTQ